MPSPHHRPYRVPQASLLFCPGSWPQLRCPGTDRYQPLRLPVRGPTERPENFKLTGAIAKALQRAGLEAGAKFEWESIRSAPLRYDWDVEMTQFYQPPLDGREEDPFARDGDDKLIRRSYWLDLSDRSIVLIMTQGIGTRLTADERRAHLIDIRRPHLIDTILAPEVLPPDRQP